MQLSKKKDSNMKDVWAEQRGYNAAMSKFGMNLIVRYALFLLASLALAACQGQVAPTPTSTPVPASATQTESPSPTMTETATATASSSPTATATATETATAGPIPGAMYYYFVAADADGPIGCGEELIPFSTGILPTGDVAADVRTVLERLFAAKVEYQYGAYNPLYFSNLIIESSQYEDSFGEIVVRTTGNLNRGEKGCDWDLIRRVVDATVRGASNGESVEVRFNQHAFNDMVSDDR